MLHTEIKRPASQSQEEQDQVQRKARAAPGHSGPFGVDCIGDTQKVLQEEMEGWSPAPGKATHSQSLTPRPSGMSSS